MFDTKKISVAIAIGPPHEFSSAKSLISAGVLGRIIPLKLRRDMSNSDFKALLGEEIRNIRQDEFLDSYGKFVEEILVESALTKREKFLILLGIYASKGWLAFTQDFLSEKLKDLNIKSEEVIETLETTVFSRGPIPWIDGNQILKSHLRGEAFERGRKGTAPSKSSGEILDYFRSRFKEVPAWIEMMGQRFPKVSSIITLCEVVHWRQDRSLEK